MADLIDGTIQGWPVSIMVERDLGGLAFGIQCVPYTDENDNPAPQEVEMMCDEISSDGTPSRLIARAKKLGFVPDKE